MEKSNLRGNPKQEREKNNQSHEPCQKMERKRIENLLRILTPFRSIDPYVLMCISVAEKGARHREG